MLQPLLDLPALLLGEVLHLLRRHLPGGGVPVVAADLLGEAEELLQPLPPPLERAEDGVDAGGQPPLEDHHGEGDVPVLLGLVVVVLDVRGDGVVERDLVVRHA